MCSYRARLFVKGSDDEASVPWQSYSMFGTIIISAVEHRRSERHDVGINDCADLVLSGAEFGPLTIVTRDLVLGYR